jgi:uncharacterized protein YjbI with pentapeptide repeats
MANEEHLAVFDKGIKAWNRWRKQLHPDTKPDLSGLDLSKADLSGFDFRDTNFIDGNLADAVFVDANLDAALLTGCNLSRANFEGAHILNAVMMNANLEGAYLSGLFAPGVLFIDAKLDGADMRDSDFTESKFAGASLVGTLLQGSVLQKCDFERANLSQADLRGAVLKNASLVDTIVEGAVFDGAEIYGISVWNLQGTPKSDDDLVIVPKEQGLVTTDDLEVAQFIYLMYDNKKIRNILNTVTGKSVLILGRFTPPERKAVLDGLREKLREHNLLPIVFDFDRPDDKDYTETVQTLAGMSRFVIADVTNPKSTPLELEAIVKQFKIPYLPIIDSSVDPHPFAMIVDLQKNFHWVLPTVAYSSRDELLANLKLVIIDRALDKHNELQQQKAREVTLLTIDDLRAAAAKHG